MQADLLAALAAREETITIDGPKGPLTVVVRELESAADGAAFLDKTDVGFKLLVRCVFAKDSDDPLFTDDQIPVLKRSAKLKLSPLMDAVMRVNGLRADDNEKNSAAAQSSG